MHQYHQLLHTIRVKGQHHDNRTGVGTTRIWGHLSRFDLAAGFPLLTTKKMPYKAAFVELLGFLRGITDARWYRERGCKIWDANAQAWNEKRGSNNIDNMGKVYGYQWRNFNGVDQVADTLRALQQRSNSRRLIISAWNPAELSEMCLPPCHILYHFCIDGNKLNVAMTQRSCDTGLGVPFNWATTALFCHIMAHCAGLEVGEMVWMGNDVHIYDNHLEALIEQHSRSPYPLPQLVIDSAAPKEPWLIEPEHLQLVGYQHHPAIKMEMAV